MRGVRVRGLEVHERGLGTVGEAARLAVMAVNKV